MDLNCYSYDHNNEHKIEEDDEEEDDYIDMEVSSFTHFFPREFEFQMSSSNEDKVKGSTTSPADELFYKGKLLPLHLPPRLQMVENLLHETHLNKFNEFYSTPLGTNTCTTPLTNTPFESCTVSPAESCQISRELNPHEYLRDFDFVNQNDQKGLVSDNQSRKSWTKKLKTKIKSLFGTSSASRNKQELCLNLDKQIKGTKKNPFGEISRMENESKEGNVCHRRSFSGAFKRRSSSMTKLSSSSSSGSSSSSSSTSHSNGLNDVQLLNRSSSVKSEIETSLIQGAIAHCKKSQQAFRSRKTLSEIGFHSFSSSSISAFDDQTRPSGLCRG